MIIVSERQNTTLSLFHSIIANDLFGVCMNCEEMIYSNDYADYMINFLEGLEGAQEIYQTGCVNPIMEKIAILHMPRTEDFLTNLERTPYSFVPKLFGLMDSSNIEAIGVKQVKNPNAFGVDGKNVIVGVVDTGIDYTNPLFLREDGRTRINVIWDQTIKGFEKSDENESLHVREDKPVQQMPSERLNVIGEIPVPLYGTVFSGNQMNRALQESDPYELVSSRDENGHGTFAAGIAAGGVDRENDFEGIASGAELAIVKLKEAKPYLREYFGVPENIPAYSETDIIYAVEYLLRYADARNMPISIFIGVGSSNGGHMGLSFLERYLTNILENPGVMVSVPAGNEGNARLHYAGEIGEDEEVQQIEFSVAQGQETLVLEFWGEVPTTFAVGLISPQGDRIERIPPRFGEEELVRFPLANTTVYVAYQMVETFTGNELIFIRLTNPVSGLWRMLVYGDNESQGRFNIWMPLRQFLQENTYFLRANPENTITSPGNAPLVTTMTAYNHLNGSIYADASRGFVARNLVKPDLTAPGVNITGPGLRNNFVRRTGTSVAAAHVAGIFALFLQWNRENPELGNFYAAQIQKFFFKSAQRQSDMEYPNVIWGYGVIDMERVFEQFRVTAFPGDGQ